jgi:iron complex outermembrane recepter protein
MKPNNKGRFSAQQAAALAVLLCFSCSDMAGAARAADYFDLTPEQLVSAQVISVSKRPQSVAQAPAAVYVISSEDIARSGVTSIPDALRMAPGVDVAQGASGSWSINIRGFNKGLADQLLVMIDGRTVYNPLFAGTYWELQNMPLQDIDRIEVVRGPGGTLWGANAVNGVINIITKKAQETQGNLISLAGGNYMRDFGLGQTGGKFGGDTYYRAYAQHFNDGAFKAPQGGSTHDQWHDTRTGFRLDQGDTLTVSGDAYLNETNQATTVPQLTAPFAVTRADDIESNGANLLTRWKNKFSDGSLLSIQSYADHTLRDQIILRDEEDIFDFDTQYNLAMHGPNEIIVGGGYRLTHEKIGNTSTLAINPATSNVSLFNAFAQDKIALVPDRWFLTVGSKVEYSNIDTNLEFQPNIRLQWFPDNRQTVWAAVSRALRTPSPLERDLDLTAVVFPPNTPPLNDPFPLKFELLGNRGFQPERVISYELGYRDKVTPDVSVDVAGFYNNYDGLAAQELVGLILTTPLPIGPATHSVLETTQANLMSAETQGVEIATEWRVSSNWKLTGSYSFLEMFLHLDNDFSNQQAEEQESPHQQANVRSYWNINKDWTLDTSVYYVDRLQTFDIPAYVRLDADLGWRIDKGVQLNLIGQNLLSSAHREFNNASDLNAAEVTRSVFGKITWQF